MILVSHNSEAGLFSHINHLITHLDVSGTEAIHVDWTMGLPYSQPSRGNLFEFLFDQISEKQPNDTVANGWPHHRYTGPQAWTLYSGGSFWRRQLNRCWQQLSVKPAILEKVNAIRASWPSTVTGVHVRNHCISTECPNGRSPNLEDFGELVDNSSFVYLATDNDEAVHYFRSILGDRLLVRAIRRSQNMTTEFHLSGAQTFEDAEDCLIDALLLARCNKFIHSVSNIATAVLYMNPNLPHQPVLASSKPHGHQKARALAERYASLIHVSHPCWEDWIILNHDGSFHRHSNPSDCGCWQYSSEARIVLRWLNWPTEEIELYEETYRFGSHHNGVNGINSLCYRLSQRSPCGRQEEHRGGGPLP